MFLGRVRYQRAADCPDARAGSRNGYCDSTIKTTAGPHRGGPSCAVRPRRSPRAVRQGRHQSNALESLVIAGFVRGLSVRDVENTLADALGARWRLKSPVSRVCQAVGDEFTQWSSRRLDGLELDYLFLDASMFKMHPGARAEPVLAAWGITTEGLGVRRFGRRRIGVHRRLGRLPQRTPGAWAVPAAAGHLRRRGRADQRRRDRAAPLAAATLSDPPISAISLPRCPPRRSASCGTPIGRSSTPTG